MSSSKIIGCGLLFAMCLISASMAQDELQDIQPIGDDKEETKREIRGLLNRIQMLLNLDNATVSKSVNLACRCSGLECKCCQRLHVSLIGLDKDLANPVPVCVGIPFLARGASICIQLDNLRVTPRSVGGCSALLVRLFFVTVAKIQLGCFNIKFLDRMEPVSAYRN